MSRDIGVTQYLDAIDDLGSDFPKVGNRAFQKYARDPQIRAAVKRRSGGKCELCGRPGFICADGSRYIEGHHVIALAKDGEDRMTNVIALCPEHHREAHFGQRYSQIETEMIRKLELLEGSQADDVDPHD